MKLFQIEEPDGGPADPSAPGAAIGIDAGGALAEVAVSVGGNAVLLHDREGFELVLTVPDLHAPTEEWRELFEGARLRAERALARPVTHAAIVLAGAADAVAADTGAAARLAAAAESAGLTVLRLAAAAELEPGATPALGAAVLAEELAPRPEPGDGPAADSG